MIYIANWKMNKSFEEEINFCVTYKNDLLHLATLPNTHIVICPSFLSLYSLTTIFKKSSLAFGAQTCSPYPWGAYTGQISALSLKQVGASYCIVGHSEQRAQGVTDKYITMQIQTLSTYTITPIICIGEHEAANEKARWEILTSQLTAIVEGIKEASQDYIIAYEPVWAIGTGDKPTMAYLEKTITWIKEKMAFLQGKKTTFKLIYGGSVDASFSQSLKAKSGLIDGFLIGNASLDFKKFEKIVL